MPQGRMVSRGEPGIIENTKTATNDYIIHHEHQKKQDSTYTKNRKAVKT